MSDLKKQLSQFLKEVGFEEKKREIAKIEKKMQEPGFWKNPHRASQIMKKFSFLQKEIEDLKRLEELAAKGERERFSNLLEKVKINLFLGGKYDQEDALLAIHAGQGGVEAMDWTAMLFRMYTRFFEKKGWRWEVVNQTFGEEAGIKSVTLVVSDSFVYGFLKGEGGVHRLVRRSPFNADHLRQTSFALVEVWPFLKETSQVKIKEEDLEWDFFRATGPGGQYVNKASTAVRVRHKPSGIVVSCQQERSQAQNRENALRILKSKLLAQEEKLRQEKLAQLKGEYKIPGWGNQIRSYILHPYQLVKDLRTGLETQEAQKVLDGEIEPFLRAYLKKFAKKGNLRKEEKN